MKKLIHSATISLALVVLLILSSCSGGDKAIFRIMPETTAGVVTFNPKNLADKGKFGELDFVRNAGGDIKILDKIINDPGSTGIKMNAYSAFFLFEKNPTYGCLVVPLNSKTKFRSFLDDIQKEANIQFNESKMGNYESVKLNNVVVAWNNSLAFILSSFSGWAGNDIDTVALRLTEMKHSESILTDKDFNKFLGQQKDINAWVTSTNLMNMTRAGDLGKALDLFGGLKNNYGHIFMDFQKGVMTLSSNLRLNATMKETVDKYNFLDKNAQKDLLRYLPSRNVFLIGNTYIDPEKIIDLLDFIKSGAGGQISDMEKKLGMGEDELRHALQGELAFSINGVHESPATKESDIYGDSSFTKNTPVFVGALKLKNEKVWTVLTEKLKEETGLTEKDGYYIVREKMLPLFLAEKDKNIIISNSEDYIKEIALNGQMEQNVLSAKFAGILTKDPVCFYVNLDQDSYSQEMQDYIGEKMGDEANMGFESFGKSLKSLAVTANLEEWEFRLELKNDTDNSLHTLLKSF